MKKPLKKWQAKIIGGAIYTLAGVQIVAIMVFVATFALTILGLPLFLLIEVISWFKTLF